MYDALVSADLVTSDPDAAATALVRLLDLPVPRRSAYLEPPGHGFRAVWLRVGPSLASAPTRLELIGARPRTELHDYVEERLLAQGDRPVRTHATVLAGDVEAVMDHLARQGIRHRLTPAGPDFDFPRVWVGVTADEPVAYRPETDAGLWIEVVPTANSGIPAPGAAPVGPGVRRVATRRFVVDDVCDAVRTLERNLCLVPAGSPSRQRARFDFANPHSASLELCAPTGDLAEFHRCWGPGPHGVVLEVGDLEHFAAGLAERGAATRRGHDAAGAPVLHLDPTHTLGVPFEFVDCRG